MSSTIPPVASPADPAAAQVSESNRDRARLKKAAQEFESVFIGMMLKQMRKSIAGDNPIFGKSQESKVYQDMMDDTMATNMSKTGSFGLAKAMIQSVERSQPQYAPAAANIPKLAAPAADHTPPVIGPAIDIKR